MRNREQSPPLSFNSAWDIPPESVTLSVVIPVYNEVATIATLLARVQAVPIEKEIILVDDGSTDGTWDVVQAFADVPNITLVRRARNQGKGAALRDGFARATNDIVIVQDADLEYKQPLAPHRVEHLQQQSAQQLLRVTIPSCSSSLLTTSPSCSSRFSTTTRMWSSGHGSSGARPAGCCISGTRWGIVS